MSAKRKLDVQTLILKHGSHTTPEDGMCIMEAVAFIAGEPHGDHPMCASPTISNFLRSWNDGLNDEERQQLKPYIARLVGSRADEKIELARAYMASDWLNRVHAPAWLALAGKKAEADELRAQVEIVDAKTLQKAWPAIQAGRAAGDAAWAAAGDAAWAAARDAAWAAARDAARAAAWDAARAAARAAAWDAAGAAAWDAAGDAAWDAARDAAWDAARDAARAAAGDAARAAARDAAWAAARDAAWAAARDAKNARSAADAALRPTRDELMRSAHDLVDRMLRLGGA